MIFLISLPFVYGISFYINNKIIYDYSIFHIFVPILIEYFIENIINKIGPFDKIFLISSFLIELIMILVFVEIIEINYCGLNKNLKRNIESRGIIDSSITIGDNDDDEIFIERNNKNNKIYEINF